MNTIKIEEEKDTHPWNVIVIHEGLRVETDGDPDPFDTLEQATGWMAHQSSHADLVEWHAHATVEGDVISIPDLQAEIAAR